MRVERFYFSDAERRKVAFEIRRTVFINEQEVDEREEFDEYDASSMHYLVYQGEAAIGTSRWRITEEGIKFERFAVLKKFRRSGAGRRLNEAMMADIPNNRPVYLHAQLSALGFYHKFGFREEGDVFSECDIKHKIMYLKEDRTSISLKQSIDHVGDFHRAFGLFTASEPLVNIDKKLIDLRFELMREENEEYHKAALEGDMIEVADALGDMLYILNGTILTHGMQHKIGPVFEEIQRSNMSKLDEDGKPIYREDGKVLKSKLYFKPDIDSILKR